MITNRRFQSILGFLSEATERWAWLHGLFRQVYLHVLTPLFEFFIRRQTQLTELSLVPRHSLVKGSRFNVFRSDIDYAAVFTSEPKAESTRAVLKAYSSLQRFLPFVGELEFYTTKEWARKLELEREDPELLDLFHVLRKAAWQLDAVERATSKYHTSKAHASLMRMADYSQRKFDFEIVRAALVKRLGEFLQTLLVEGKLQKDLPARGDFLAFSGFLQWNYGTVPAMAGELSARLSAPCCVLLAAILPDGTRGMSHSSVYELRKRPDIRRLFLVLCESELLLCQSVRRGKTERDDALEAWMQNLRLEIGARSEPPNLTFSPCEP
ncbi:MAG: hypothetical protein ACXVA9_05695 [Bdellovibrionales bacterium]